MADAPLLLTLLLAIALPAWAQDLTDTADGVGRSEPPSVEAYRLPEPAAIDLDGRLSDGAWERAEPITDFVQVEPREGAEPSERTEVRILYDADALYIGAKLFGDPAEILAFQRRRDAGLRTDDRFMWILDTFRDGRTGYFFEINPAGLMGDGLLGAGGPFGVNKSWDGVWEARTARLADGWSAEIRIPFSTLNFDPADDTWGINFQRTVRRRNEEIRWSGSRRNQPLFDPVHAGTLSGIHGVSQGLGLEVTPYAVQNWREAAGGGDAGFAGDVGFDVGYSITPSLRAAVSVNTDFAEVEVDERRVNLTRFPLRFPEQRDFFLEGSGVFSFAPRSGPSPYFSRRIGLRSGEAVPIDFGARLGGQAGAYELGFLQIRTAETGAFGREDFTVARVKRAIFERSTIGAVYTRRASAPGPAAAAPADRHTIGLDLDYATSRLFGDQNFELEAFVVWNSDADPDADRGLNDLTARGFRFNFPNDLWQAHLSYREFGAAYAPAVGFVSRNDFRRVEPRVAWRPRPAFLPAVRQVTFAAQFRYLESLLGGMVEERRWDFELGGIEFESGDRVEVNASHLYEYLDRPFDVADGVGVLPGGYQNWEQSVSVETAGRRPLSLEAGLERGGFWDGERTGWQLELTVRPRPGVSASLDYNHNQVTLPRGAFDTNLLRLNTGWDLSPWTSVRTSVQYDDVSEVLGVFGLLRWILRPGNEIFLVYTHNWLYAQPGENVLDRRFTTLTRGASAKVTYSFRW